MNRPHLDVALSAVISRICKTSFKVSPHRDDQAVEMHTFEGHSLTGECFWFAYLGCRYHLLRTYEPLRCSNMKSDLSLANAFGSHTEAADIISCGHISGTMMLNVPCLSRYVLACTSCILCIHMHKIVTRCFPCHTGSRSTCYSRPWGRPGHRRKHASRQGQGGRATALRRLVDGMTSSDT